MNSSSRNTLLYVISWLTDFSVLLLVFTVSRDLAEEGASLLKMGIVGGGISLAHAASSFIFGHISDRFGRRRLILAGIITLLLSAIGCLFLMRDSSPYFLAYWSAGLGSGLIYPPLIAWLNEGQRTDLRSKGISRVIIRFCIAWNAGLICGQLGGGWLFPFGRHYPMALAAILSVLSMTCLLFTGRRSSKPHQLETKQSDLDLATKSASLVFTKIAWISNFGSTFSVSIILHLFPKLTVSLDIPSGHHGMILASMRGFVIVSYLLMHRASFWQYRFSVILCVGAIAICGLLGLVFVQGELGLTCALIGFAVYAGFNYFSSLYYSSTGRPDQTRGFASGVHEATLGFGLGAGAICGGALGQTAGIRSPYILAAGVIVILTLIQVLYYIRKVNSAMNC